MNELNVLFRKRIGIPVHQELSFEDLPSILVKTGTTIPFENLGVITKKNKAITKENLVNKILVRNEGGLCYELNTLLYFFLLDNGFDIKLARGVVYNHVDQVWGAIGRTHVTILLNYGNKQYLVDSGFAGNIPLRPVPLDGEIVRSSNGDFQVQKTATNYGDYILKLKLNHKDVDWRIGYAFDSKQIVDDLSQLNDIQTIICENPGSSFNKSYLINILTSDGSLTLTDTSFTQWKNGKVEKEKIESEQFKQLAMKHFGITNL
ncbi:arylamine N-acetyltransferase family protein [Bacillus sp. Marseille-P3661]|uniref:arylamine N-acetyltransferase family protein n=1 Tax=Bacillus sp. Marseille-P3661 TaxID=1936234 RepID=UPI000C86622F|nr:arylamine N-acetyltransferase [Bacillus sp. Marseille-P3661]